MLVPLVVAVMPAERPPRWLSGGPSGLLSPAHLLAGLAAAMIGLARLAIAGFGPAGNCRF